MLGVQYFHNDGGQHRGSWIVRRTDGFGWLFAGTNVTKGSPVGNGGIEADRTTSASPKSTKIVAEIPNLYGPGLTAQMTYYETKAGAKVFAAGAFTLAGAIGHRQVQQLVNNLFDHLSQP